MMSLRRIEPTLRIPIRAAGPGAAVALLTLLLTLPVAARAQAGGAGGATPADLAEGETSFRHHCAACHGANGHGGDAPDLTRAQLHRGDSDEALFRTIRFGIPGTEMPGTRFPDSRVRQVIAYLRSLRQAAKPLSVPGDAARGKALFEGRGGCLACHWVNGNGGRSGPELSRVGAARSLAGLRSSLLDPNADLDDTYWQWEAKGKDGKLIRGIRLSEDTFSIRILDSRDNLVAIDKDQVTGIRVLEESSMPSYRDALSPAEIDDLIAYLHSLR
jgi:putative heme-binding domain-containing protein